MMEDCNSKRRFPIRTPQHVTEDTSLSILRDCLPNQWIVRTEVKDYGLDGEIEIVSDDGFVKGDVFKFQAKGHKNISQQENIYQQIDMSTVNYWLEFPLPIILFIIDTEQRCVYWLDAKDYIKRNYSTTKSKLRSQKTITFAIPKSNVIPNTIQDIAHIAVLHKENIANFENNLAKLEMLEKHEEEETVADFIRYHILVQLFNCEIEAYETYLRQKGTDEQIISDFPFLVWLKESVKNDRDLMNRIKRLVEESD
jgi:hypothetical protein